MTEYLKDKFTVPLGGEKYRDGWERIFGVKLPEVPHGKWHCYDEDQGCDQACDSTGRCDCFCDRCGDWNEYLDILDEQGYYFDYEAGEPRKHSS